MAPATVLDSVEALPARRQLRLLRLVALRLSRPLLPPPGRRHGRQPDLRGRHREPDRGVRRVLVLAAVVANLGVLACFKYAEWVIDGVNGLGEGTLPLVDVILPIGISFFMFQAISYVIDAYRGDLQPVALLDFAVYLSFFPHLVAGPIVRVREFLPQIEHPGRSPLDRRGPGLPSDHVRAVQEGDHRRAARHLDRRPGLQLPDPVGASTTCSASTPTPSRSTPTSPATPTSPSAWRCCSASSSRRTSTRRTSPSPSRTSGAAGT